MKYIRDFIESELEHYRKECNFTDDELAYFNMKAKDYSDNKITIELNVSISKVNKLSRQVRDKVKRVDRIYLSKNDEN